MNVASTSLIEEWFPVRELSRDAAIEMAYKAKPAYIKHCRELKIPEKNITRVFFDPKIRNLHPWFARRPCSIARAITLASALPIAVDNETFMRAIGWNEKLVFLRSFQQLWMFFVESEQKLNQVGFLQNLNRFYCFLVLFLELVKLASKLLYFLSLFSN